MSSPPLSQPGDPAGLLVQAAGSLNSGLASAPGPGPGPASSSEYGASSWRPGHPVVARGGPWQVNWRWPCPQRPAHRAGTPGWLVHALPHHAITSGRPDSAHSTACRAAWRCAPIVLNLPRAHLVAQASRSKVALISRSVPPADGISLFGIEELPHFRVLPWFPWLNEISLNPGGRERQ
jgi:hypothetical protein